MAQALAIDFQQLLITTKIVVQLPYPFAVVFGHLTNPFLDSHGLNGRHLYIQCTESYHLIACFSSGNIR